MLTAILEHTKSLEEEMLLLREEVEANRSALANIIRIGVVDKVGETTVDIKTGENKATTVPFFVHCAGRVSHYRRPSEGELCILINLGSGDNLNNAVALMGLPSTKFPFPSVKENEVVTDYGNGMIERYDLDKGSMEAHYPGGLKIIGNTEQDGNYKSSGDVSDGIRSMKADREIYNKHDHISSSPGNPTSPPKQKKEKQKKK